MTISESLLPEFDQEMAGTRKTLERIPDGKFDWKPHEKSMPLGNLVSHLATLPLWAVFTLQQEMLDLAPADGQALQMPKMNTPPEALKVFDNSVADGRAAIAAATDEEWSKPWTLKAGEHTLFTLPKIAVMRTWVLNHNIHHRAQLGVYLRLNDLPVPSIYGPTADEDTM